jgi:3-hydroxyacyl-[acyl-carrier-protein] dehydratase
MGQPLIDLASVDLSRDVISEEELRKVLPHRGNFVMLDGVCHFDRELGVAVGYKDWPADAWWAKDHIPGMPLLPGVLMIEGAAQLATVLIKKISDWEIDRFLGIADLNDVRFRGKVVPPARIYYVVANTRFSGKRLARVPAQAVSAGQMIVELDLLGALL